MLDSQQHLMGKLLELVQGDHDTTSEPFWDEIAILIVKHWAQFEAKQGAAATMAMLERCGLMKLKIRLAKAKTGGDDVKDEADEFERLMASVFAAEEG